MVLPRSMLALAAPTLLLACGEAWITGDHSYINDNGARITISQRRGERTRRAELLRLPGAEDRLRIEQLTVEGGTLDERLAWLWEILDGDTVLVTGAGEEWPHPDRVLLDSWQLRLQSGDAAPADVLAGCGAMIRVDSRAALFAAAVAAAPDAESTQRLALGCQSALWAPRQGGLEPAGSAARAVVRCAQELAASPHVNREIGDVAARWVSFVDSSSRQRELLTALVGVASPAAIAAATTSISSSNNQREVLLELARQPTLDGDAVAAITAAIAEIDSSSAQRDVLLALVGRASAQQLLSAATEIDSGNRRADVLRALAAQDPLPKADADALAAASATLSSSSARRELLLGLIGTADPAAVLAAAREIDSSHRRGEVLRALAATPDLSVDVADDLVRASGGLTSAEETAVLRALIGRASTDVLIEAAAEVSSSRDRASLMEAIARRGQR